MKKNFNKISLSMVLILGFAQHAQASSLLEEFIPIKDTKEMINGGGGLNYQKEFFSIEKRKDGEYYNKKTKQYIKSDVSQNIYQQHGQQTYQVQNPQEQQSGLFGMFNLRPDQISYRNEHNLLIDICKNSLNKLYAESMNPPTNFTFKNINIIENNQGNNTLVYLDYKTTKEKELIEQKFMCDFALETSYTDRKWTLVSETTSY